MLTKRQLAAATHHQHTIEQTVPTRANHARLLVGTETVRGQRLVVVVGASLDPLQRAENQLVTDLAIALPILALVVIAAGWVLAGAALRPVRRMVGEADAFSTQRRGQRLSVPSAEEIAELARRLNAMLGRIEEAIDHEHAFLDDASHELRTPIAIARAEIELAAMQATDPAGVAALASALEEVERLDHLAANLLVLARVRAAGPPPAEPVDLSAVAERAVDDVERARPREGVELHVGGDASATGDAAALERAITNLVDNATRVRTQPGRRDARARTDGRRSRCATTVLVSRSSSSTTLSTGSCAATRAGAPDSGSRSSTPWPVPTAGGSRSRTTRPAARGCSCGSRSPPTAASGRPSPRSS